MSIVFEYFYTNNFQQISIIPSFLIFPFITIKEKNKSIAYFDMELTNKSIVRVKAYNARADYIYRNYKMNQFIVIKGNLL